MSNRTQPSIAGQAPASVSSLVGRRPVARVKLPREIEVLAWRHSLEQLELEDIEGTLAEQVVLSPDDLRRLEKARKASATALVACPFVSWGDAGHELAKECLRARDFSERFNALRAGAVPANDQGGYAPATPAQIEAICVELTALSAAWSAGGAL